MSSIPRPIRIDPAFDDPELVRALFERHAPYPAIARYLPDGYVDETSGQALPWFRGTWATNGAPLVDGAEMILHNPRFIAASRRLFGTSRLRPTFVVVNLHAPMPAGAMHVDIPTFHGATRDQYPLRFLKVMGASGLFEKWRVIQAGAVAWFYDGPGGNFEYWPEGRDGPMRSEQPPFCNVALMADNDRTYHRIGRVGNPDANAPRMTPAAEIRPVGGGTWAIVESGETVATYPSSAIRLSIVWKANLESEADFELLTLDRVMDILTADLRQRAADFRVPSDPLSDAEWNSVLERTYCEAPSS